MSRIRSKNTAPELIVFADLRRRGLRFQQHYDRVPGKPDIARPRKKLAVFIDGDFWHGRELERVVRKHGEDSEWASKLRRNMERDRQQEALLMQGGWLVLRIWASDVVAVRSRESTMDAIERFLRSRD
jgi:DNA mismatch endonuclease (patch repair protein)